MNQTQGTQEYPVAVHPPESLLQFDDPLYVGAQPSGMGRGGRGPVPAAKESATSQLDDMLNAMIPPREWVEDSGVWMQYASKESATRLDVITLQEQLDQKLMERKARESGICPVREDLYKQALDELIRQVTLDSPERGLLLMRVRDEIRMTIDAYKTLYDSSITFGIRKQLQAEQGMDALETRITDLEGNKKKLENKVFELRNKAEMLEKREVERKAADDKRRKDELDFLKYQGQHLDSFLKQMNTGK